MLETSNKSERHDWSAATGIHQCGIFSLISEACIAWRSWATYKGGLFFTPGGTIVAMKSRFLGGWLAPINQGLFSIDSKQETTGWSPSQGHQNETNGYSSSWLAKPQITALPANMHSNVPPQPQCVRTHNNSLVKKRVFFNAPERVHNRGTYILYLEYGSFQPALPCVGLMCKNWVPKH